MKKKFIYSLALLMGAMTFAACSSDNDDNGGSDHSFNIVTTTPLVDDDNYPLNTATGSYTDKSLGQLAIDRCIDVVNNLEAANAAIASSKLTEAQEAYLRKTLETLVSNVIVPTYTKLADNTEAPRKDSTRPDHQHRHSGPN